MRSRDDIAYHTGTTQTVGVVDEDTANIVEGVADAAQNQAEADRDATIADRLKTAGMQRNGTYMTIIIILPHGQLNCI